MAQTPALAGRLRRLASAARESAQIAQADRAARDAAIEEADADGWNLPDIAREVGMSTSHVQRIVIATTAVRQERNRQRPETDFPCGTDTD